MKGPKQIPKQQQQKTTQYSNHFTYMQRNTNHMIDGTIALTHTYTRSYSKGSTKRQEHENEMKEEGKKNVEKKRMT